MKKILDLSIIIGVLSMILLFSVTVHASSILKEQTENVENYAEDTQYSLLRGNHLSYGTIKLTELSSNSINVYGSTLCHHVCDNVYLSIYLERKVNGSYATYKSWIYNTTDASSLTKNLVVSVPTGYYYRVRAYHAASDGGSAKESVTSLTDGVYVG